MNKDTYRIFCVCVCVCVLCVSVMQMKAELLDTFKALCTILVFYRIS